MILPVSHDSQDALEREQRLDEAVISYLEAVEAGRTPDRQEWLVRHADLAADLAEFLADHDRARGWTRPLRAVAQQASIAREDPNRTLSPTEDRASPAAADSFGDYQLLEEIGRGGMGVVWKARQRSLQRIIALKMILTGPLSSPMYLERFRAEAAMAAYLDHPHIVPIYEVGEHEGQPYFSMKLIEGGSLAQWISDGRLPIADLTPSVQADVAGLMSQVARAVHHAHQRGILHRDLKPGNILLQIADSRVGVADLKSEISNLKSAIPMVTDFGLAKRLEADRGLSRSGEIVGTPSYMAPEQALGQKVLTTAVDVYSIGAILYELLTGRPPFQAATPLQTLVQVLDRDLPRPQSINPRVNRDLETICLKCLQKDLARRYASALALAEDLESFLVGEPIRARPTTAWERGSKWARRRPAAAGLLAVSAAALLGLVAGGALYQDQRARVAEKDVRESRRLDSIRTQVQQLLIQAQRAAGQEDWHETRRLLAAAREVLRPEPSLEDLESPVERLLNEAEDRLAALHNRQQADARYQRFLRLRDDALFRGTLFTGVDLPANLQATRHAAWEALDLFGLKAEPEAGPLFGDSFTTDQRQEITNGCYELLLILAEAQAHEGTPERLEQALELLDRARRLGPQTQAYQQKRARYLKQLGKKAESVTRSADSALDHFLLGEDLRRNGHLAAAVREFDQALQSKPSHFWAHYFRAVCSLATEPRVAQAHLTACLQQERDYTEWVHLLRGIAHTRLDEFAAAEADFQKAQEARRDDANLRYAVLVNRGVLRLRQGRWREAVTGLQQAFAGARIPFAGLSPRGPAQKLEEAVIELRAATSLQPDGLQAYWNLARAYRLQGKLEAALAELGHAIDVGRKLEPAALADLYRDRARLHSQHRDLAAALADLDRAVAVAPSAADHAERGRLLYAQGKPLEAVAAYDKALAIEPLAVDVCRWRAEALVAQTKFKEAEVWFDRFLERGGRPGSDFYQARGQTRTHLGKYAAAIQDFNQALALRPESSTYAQRGWVYLVEFRAPLVALDDFEAAIRLNARNADAYMGRGSARVALGHYPAAVEDTEVALRLGPRDQLLLYKAARVYAQAVARLDEQRWQTRSAPARRSEYQDRALRLLRQALDSSPARERATFWRNYLQRTDHAFDPIRQSPGFVRLAAEYSN